MYIERTQKHCKNTSKIKANKISLVFSVRQRKRNFADLKLSQKHASMNEANKYIFVCDFNKAEVILREIISKDKNHSEAFFRLVEIVHRKESLTPLILELENLDDAKIATSSISFAVSLAKIRNFASTSKASKKNNLINIDMKKIEELKSRYLDTKKTDFTFLDYSPQEIRQKISILPNKKIKINRQPEFPDDMFIENKSILIPENIDDNILNAISIIKKEDDNISDLLNEEMNAIYQLHKQYPNRYEGWFLAGCLLETVNKLDEAIKKWRKSFQLNPNSICTISALSDLQQMGYLIDDDFDYTLRFEKIDKYLVHGHFDTHTDLHNEFLSKCDYKNAITALKTLADWLQRQYGDVPSEIEILCLLGAMNAYQLDNKSAEAEICLHEAENIILSYKHASKNLKHLLTVAHMCEEYKLHILAKLCYFSIISSNNASIDLVLQAASICLKNYANLNFIEHLKIAYKNHGGDLEIRFMITQTLLIIKGIDPDKYAINKNIIRGKIQQGHSQESIQLLFEILSKFDQDPETQAWMADGLSKLGKVDEAIHYFENLIALDPYNANNIINYIFFLIKQKKYTLAISFVQTSLFLPTLTQSQINELYWCMSACYYIEKQYDLSKEKILYILEFDPWNSSYILLYTRILIELNSEYKENLSDKEALLKEFEENFNSNNHNNNEEKNLYLYEKIISYSQDCLDKNMPEIAWNLSKLPILMYKRIPFRVFDLIAKTASAYDAHLCIRELLFLLKKSNTIFKVDFSDISSCVAIIYSYISAWNLTQEWIDLTRSNKHLNPQITSLLLELEALIFVMQGYDLKRAQSLLNAAIDGLDNKHSIHEESLILQGYILVILGNYNEGIEKMMDYINQTSSIRSLYFFVKGMDHAGRTHLIDKDIIHKIYNTYPKNLGEQKMIEELFFVVGKKISPQGSPLGLAS